MEQSKACTRCSQIKPLTEFGNHKSHKDGKDSSCFICRRKSRAEYRIRNKEKIKLEQHDNYLRNREKRIAYAKKWKNQNPELSKKHNSISKKKNREKIAANTRRRNARLRQNGIYKISKKELKKLAETACFYCGSRQNLTVDHVIAIARGGTDSIGNLVSACKSCNSQKRQLTIMEWRIKNLK